MQEDYSLLIASVYKLVEKIQAQQFITSVSHTDNEISFTYKNGFKQRFSLVGQNNAKIDLDTLKKDIYSQISNKLNKDFADSLDGIQKAILLDSDNYKSKCDSLFNDLKDEFSLKTESDHDNLFRKLDNRLKKLVASLPTPKDGKDADVSLIIATITKTLEDKIEEYKKILDQNITIEIEKNIANIPVPQNGLDGKDADEQRIIDKLLEELRQILESDLLKLKNAINQEFITLYAKQREELSLLFTTNITEILSLIPAPQNGRDGKDGINGKDADNELIEANILQKANTIIAQGIKESQSELIDLINELIKKGLVGLASKIKSIKAERGRQGDKGEKGDDGKEGNGIIDAEINEDDHLIIETRDKTIDAGKLRLKKYYGGGGGSNVFLYTNELPMPVDVGLLPQGTKFKDVDLRILFTKLLYGYNFPSFADFTIDGLPDNVEIGYTIAGGDYPANFTISDPELLRVNSISISKDNLVLLDNLPNVSPVNITLFEEKWDTPNNITFEISAYDTTGVSFNRYFILGYKYKIYYGEYGDDITDTGFDNPLKVLRASELVVDIYGEYFFQNIPLGSNYKWFCYPAILGENYIFYDVVTDIALVLNDVLKINIVNEYGLNLEYNCYRTLNEIHNDIIMKVKNG